MTRRNVLLMSYCLEQGGSERQLTEIARHLDPARYSVQVVCLRKEGLRLRELEAAGIPVTEFRVASFKSPAALRHMLRLAAHIRAENIHIAHAFDAPMAVFGVPAARLAGCPIVLSSQRGHRSLTTGFVGKLLPLTDHLVDGIVVNCEYMRAHLRKDAGVPDHKIHLCYNGLDAAVFHPRPEARNGGLVIGSICALRPEKNLELLLHAFAANFSSAKLVIVGDGPMLPSLRTLAQTLDIAPRCHFVPSTADVASWLQSMDIFVLPSRTEAFSNSIMEAMACGCMTIASNVGGNPELIGDDERGKLFASGDANALARVLEEAARDAAMRNTYGIRARAFVEEHLTIAQSARRMSEIYEASASKKLS